VPEITVRNAAPPRVACRSSVVLLLVALVVSGCREKAPAARSRGTEPQVDATVVTIRTQTGPENKVYNHSIFIREGVARSGDEVDVWHLYDTTRKRVTVVDEIAGTHRVEEERELVAAAQRTTAKRTDNPVAGATIARASGSMVTLGVQTIQSVITAGSYRRELWFGTHPQIPPRLYSLMYATRLAGNAATGVNPRVDAALLAMTGFPLIDRAELPYGDKKMTVERTVVKVEQKPVPRAWFELPNGSRDLTPPREPQGRKRR
jgi:hypothetical protein